MYMAKSQRLNITFENNLAKLQFTTFVKKFAEIEHLVSECA